MKIGWLGALIGLICTLESRAQDYQAIQGSPFAGSLGVAENPATILMTPYPWDITIFSVQLKNSTNAVGFSNFSYLKHGDTLGYDWANGNIRRYADLNYNVHLLNVRLALGHNRRQAISFGANIRGYLDAKAGNFNYNDTLQNMNQFLFINQGTTFQTQAVSSSWLEIYGTYSKTLWDDDKGRLNGGVTLRVMRGISGGYVQLAGGTVNRSAIGAATLYALAAGNAQYGYSANYDTWHSTNSTWQNLKDFVTHTQGGAGMDIGFEYVVKTQAIKLWSDPDDYFDYEWKFGASLLDVGENLYVYGTQSRRAGSPNSNATDFQLNEKFDYVQTLAGFNDSLAAIVNNISIPSGKFRIWTPARFEFNVDRLLPQHFAINANGTLNLGGNNKGTRLFNKELTLVAVTPRWETKSLGAYLPIQVTTEGRVWVGGAFKAGPLLLGVHNWASVFTKTHLQQGGFYLALVLRPGKGFFQREEKKYTCPTD